MSKEKIIGGEQQPKTKEKKVLSEKELQGKNIVEFLKLQTQIQDVKNIGKSSIAIEQKNGLKIEITSRQGRSISIRKVEDKVGFSEISLMIGEDKQFYVRTEKDSISGKNPKQENYIKLKPSQVKPYIDAIYKRFNKIQKSTQKSFIELSVNQDQHNADNLIETIEEQTV